MTDEKPTIINDPVHGHIQMDSLYMKVVDTLQFQRLRFLRQQGANFFVFPGAVHTRFEHSIGVCYLAETLCKVLREKQPELNITDRDVKCVAIAGLCHDLGHGPFSHLFDLNFISKFGKTWKHEMGSVAMFDYLIEENGLRSLFTPEDLIFIKEQILPPNSNEGEHWCYKGRGPEKSFLYEIVANKRNGIDVDKWDYIARDSHYLGIKTAFDHNRLMKFVRVLEVNGEKQICTRAKEVDSLYELFHSRICLYRQAYLHKTSLIIDHMISRALEDANDHFFIEDNDGFRCKMSDTIYHMPAFVKLTDNIFHSILCSNDSNLMPAKKWLKRILSRDLPKIIGRFKCTKDHPWTAERIIEEMRNQAKFMNIKFEPKDLIIIRRKFDYGMGTENPIDRCWFYNKHNLYEPYKVKKEQVSSFLPSKFIEIQYLAFYDGSDENRISDARRCYEGLCLKFNVDISMGSEQSGILITPLKTHEVEDGCSENKKVKRSIEF